MRIGIISDLHSNREALEAVFEHLRGQQLDELYCLGDVVGYGPDPEFCVDLVRGHAQLCLLGNHDEALFREATDFNPHARGAIEYTRRIMKPRWYSSVEKKARWRWLQELPLTHRNGRFLFVHGSPRDPVREYVLSTDGFLNPDKLRGVFESFEGIAIGGHTHHPGMHDENLHFHGLDGRQSFSLELPPEGKFFLNVGSVGQPRDGDNRACYAVLEEQRVTWHRVEYDWRTTMQKIIQCDDLSNLLGRRLQIGK
jgi:predicted phosphodiesterase